MGAGPNQLTGANGVQAAYDESGNLIELRIQRQAICPSGSSSRCAQLLRYDWDEVGQLVRARRWDFATMPPLSAGELPTVVVPGVGAVPIDPDWDIHYAYSLGGRVVKSAKDSAGIQTHTLDVFDTLRFDRVEFATSTEDYDRDPRLTHLFLGGGVGHIVFDPGMPFVTSPAHRFINIGDHLGSGTITIDGETSELVERTTYQAFGATESDYRTARWSDHREDLKFTGKEEDIEVGLTYFGARYYAAHLGRWASADPLTIHAFGADLNPYAYVRGRVMSYVDPFGLADIPKTGTITQPNGTVVTTTCNPCADAVEQDYMSRSLEALDRGGTFGTTGGHFAPPMPNVLGTPPEVGEDLRNPDGTPDKDYQAGQQKAAFVWATIGATRIGFGALFAADAVVAAALRSVLTPRTAVVGAGAGVAAGGAQQQGCSSGAGCAGILVRNFGGTGSQQIGVIRVGTAAPSVALEARAAGGISHADLAVKAWGPVAAEGERRLGFSMIGQDVFVGHSATGHLPTAADVGAIQRALSASGLQFQQVLVHVDGKLVVVK